MPDRFKSRPERAPSNPRRDRDLAWLARLREPGCPAPTEPPATEEFSRALREFNEGEFFRCHETLEALWLREKYPQRLFYQGILKVAVGLLHRERGNDAGARAKLGEGLEMLEPFTPRFMGVEVSQLRTEVRDCLERLDEVPQKVCIKGYSPTISQPR